MQEGVLKIKEKVSKKRTKTERQDKIGWWKDVRFTLKATDHKR